MESALSTFELIVGAAHAAPERDALIFLPDGALETPPVVLSRQAMASRIIQAANVFTALGVGSKDVVSFLLPNLPQTQFVFWGAQAAGIVNPINFLLDVDHIADVMNAAKSKILVAFGPHPVLPIWQKAQALREKTNSLKTILVAGGNAQDGALSLDVLMAEASGAELTSGRSFSPKDVAAYFHTGGTTGKPKLVQHTHENEVHAAIATATSYEFAPGDTVMCGLPMFHVAAPILLSLAPLAAGARILLPSAAGLRDPEIVRNYWEICNKYAVTVVGGVPTSLSDILNTSDAKNASMIGNRICMTGGAQLTVGLQKRFRQETGIAVHQIYGMTETAGAISVAPRNEQPKLGSVGKAIPGLEAMTFKIDAQGERGEACAHGEAGVIFVRGPNTTERYITDDAGAISARDADGWLNTGDLGYIDDDGWIFITGRAKDVIIRSGHNIEPAMIEEAVERHPAVASAVAVGRPDARAGETPVVFVTLNDDAGATEAEIKDFAIDNVPEAPAKPAAVYIVPEIPLTAVGKVFRPALRREAARAAVFEKFAETLQPGEMPEIVVDPTCEHAIRLLIHYRSAEEKERGVELFDAWLSQHTFDYEYV